jgi:hypothetical protein
MTVLLNNAGVFAPTQHTLTAIPLGIGAGDVTGDGRPDLIVTQGNQRFVVFTGSATGAFNPGTPSFSAQAMVDVEIADLNSDGALDASFTNQSSSAIIADNQGGGVFPDGPGTGSGDYFMTFNVAFQPAGNPDPVAQLQTLYDAWRTALVARPDGVQSLSAVNPATVPGNGAATAELTFTLRDWQGQPVTAGVQQVTVAHAPGSAGISSIGTVQSLGNGQYRVVLTAGNVGGVDRFRVMADDGQRPVFLMPDPALTIENTCYADCNNSASLTIADFGCFQSRFASGDPYADCNNSSTLTIADFACFQAAFAAGCP